MVQCENAHTGDTPTRRWDFQPPPEDSEIAMEFRLIYMGPLPSESSSSPRPRVKHEIRKQLHAQLAQYWKEHPQLRMKLEAAMSGGIGSTGIRAAMEFSRGPHRFIPVARKQEDNYCSLNILFLRRDAPGNLVQSGGDLDNRLKVLLDALRVPDSAVGLPDMAEEGFDPIFCLLQDNDQITTLNVTTDRILSPLEPGDKVHNVVLVIHVHLYRGTNVSQISGLPGSA